MRRRDFISGSSAVFIAPVGARAQQKASPLLGFLSGRSEEVDVGPIEFLKRGLHDSGFVIGNNLAAEFRYANGERAKLLAMAADLVTRQAAVIVTVAGFAAAQAAQQATSSIPIVFVAGGDPVEQGLVTSLSRPDKNMTGVVNYNSQLETKQLELLREIAPRAAPIGALFDANSTSTKSQVGRLRISAAERAINLIALEAGTEQALHRAFEQFEADRVQALLVGAGAFFGTNRQLIIRRIEMLKIAAIFSQPEYVEAGGLASYSFNSDEIFRLAGKYAGLVLKGQNPSDLAIAQSTLLELAINQKAARAIGIEMSPQLLAIADKVIE